MKPPEETEQRITQQTSLSSLNIWCLSLLLLTSLPVCFDLSLFVSISACLSVCLSVCSTPTHPPTQTTRETDTNTCVRKRNLITSVILGKPHNASPTRDTRISLPADRRPRGDCAETVPRSRPRALVNASVNLTFPLGVM